MLKQNEFLVIKETCIYHQNGFLVIKGTCINHHQHLEVFFEKLFLVFEDFSMIFPNSKLLNHIILIDLIEEIFVINVPDNHW